jgi:cell division septal protein FtsQ
MNTPWNSGASKRRFRDYHKRQYGNPLFDRTGRGGKRSALRDPGSAKRTALVALGTIAIVSLCWYLFWSPTFRIVTVEVNGATPPTESRIRDIVAAQQEQRALLVFPRRSVFLFDKAGTATAIEDVFHLESLSLKKRLPGTLVIDVTEIPKRAVLHTHGKFLAVSETGTVIRELTEREIREIGDMPPEIAAGIEQQLGAQMVELSALATTDAPEAATRNGNAFPLLFDGDDAGTSGNAPVPGEAIFSGPTLSLILQANTRLPDITGDAVRWFTVRERDEAVDVTLAADWHLYLTTTLPFEIQGERLSLVLKEKVGTDRPRLQYVDLRYNERIFIKLKDAEPEQK